MLLAVSIARAECPSSPDALHARAGDVVEAWRAWSWSDFDTAVADVAASVSCVDAVLVPDQAAELHLVFALAAARRKDLAATTDAFRALRTVDPAWTLHEDLGVPGTLLAMAWQDASAADNPNTVLLPGRGWVVDGTPTGDLPMDRPTFLQKQSPLATWHLAGGVLPEGVKVRRRHPTVVWGLAGAAAVLSAGAFTAAGVAYGAYPEADANPERLEAVNHAGVIGGAVLAAGAVGLSGVAVIAEW